MPANPFSESLHVQVTGDATGASSALQSLQGTLLSTKGAALALSGVMAGTLAAVGLAKATQAAADFESAMVEVQKVTDAETAAELSGEVRNLAETIPLAQEEIAGLTADAARFGIEGTDNITNFAETAAKMATATELTADQAGQSLAKLGELTNTPVGEMENLGSSINTLSNNFATSSDEIVDGMLRSSAALSQFGLNQKEIAGFSAALNEVSESSRRAGSRLRRVAQELMDPNKTKEVASALGMTVDEFKTMRQEAPRKLMLKLVETFKRGGKRADELRSSLSTTSRQAVSGLAQNLDGLREALNTSNKAFKEGSSLQREFDAATDTFNARLKLLMNNLNDIAITVGNKLLPVLNPLLESLNDLLESGGDLGMFGEEVKASIDIARGAFDELRKRGEILFSALREVWETHGKELFGEGGEAMQTFQAFQEFWKKWGDEITTVTQFIFEGVVGVIKTAFDLILTIIRTIMNVLQGDWEEAWDAMAGFLERTLDGLLSFAGKWGKALFEAIVGALPEQLRGAVRSAVGVVSELNIPDIQANRPTPTGGQRPGERVVIENREVIQFEGGDEITQIFADIANRQMDSKERRADRLRGRR